MNLKKAILPAVLMFSAISCTNAVTRDVSTQTVANSTIFGKWQTTEKTSVTTPFNTVWTLNSAKFGTDGKTLTGEFTKEDGNPMTEHLSYEFVKNYQSTGKDAVLMRNSYMPNLVVTFTVEKLTATDLELKAIPVQNAGPLDFGTGILKFKRIK